MNHEEIAGQLKSQCTCRLFFLSVITLNIYAAHYMKRQTNIINQHLDWKYQISKDFMNIVLIFTYACAILVIPRSLVEEVHPVEAIGLFLNSALSVLFLIWGFKARNRMNTLLGATRQDRSRWFHGLWTFLFPVFYFNFKINSLSEHFADQGGVLDEDFAPLYLRQ